VIIDNGDGTYGQGTETYSFRTAAGKALVDKAPAVRGLRPGGSD
jgi:hypothetical protein